MPDPWNRGGGGLILNNSLYRGEGSVAGELGHMPLNEHGPKCKCGGQGCHEKYVGNRILLSNAKRMFRKRIDLPEVHELALQGNKKALKFWSNTGTRVGNGLVGVTNLLNPCMIILNVGVSSGFNFMSKTIRVIVKKRAMLVQGKMVRIVKAKLGNDAGIIGAQELIKEALG